MKKFYKYFILIFLLLGVTLLASCAAGDRNSDADLGGGSQEGSSVIINNSTRKIIYTANISVKSDDLLQTTRNLKDLLEEDEWFDSEHLTANSNNIVFRVRTSRLDSFISEIRTNYETTNYSLDSKDISLDYISVASQIDSLEAERARLVVLYENANMNDMISINRRIGEIDNNLIYLNRTISEYDSKVDYSTIRVWIYGPTANPNPPSYGTQLSRTFSKGWDTTLALIKGLIQIVVFLVPFLVIVVPAGAAVFGVVYYDKIRKAKKNKPEDKENKE